MNKVSSIIKSIEGCSLHPIFRASNMLTLSFGDTIEISDRRGTKKLGVYGLHIQCFWRIKKEGLVFISHRDFYLPNSKISEEEFENLDWDTKGLNRFDELALDFNSLKLNVLSIEINITGDLLLIFSNNFSLEVMINTSYKDIEFWRFIERTSNNESKHLVFTGIGFKYSPEEWI
ncbi:MAG: hypothetical protein SFU98_12210 [Leptospiraceae bacterium]|nr:hypothetical protein [Leptospiraceae bacterium]